VVELLPLFHTSNF